MAGRGFNPDRTGSHRLTRKAEIVPDGKEYPVAREMNDR